VAAYPDIGLDHNSLIWTLKFKTSCKKDKNKAYDISSLSDIGKCEMLKDEHIELDNNSNEDKNIKTNGSPKTISTMPLKGY